MRCSVFQSRLDSLEDYKKSEAVPFASVAFACKLGIVCKRKMPHLDPGRKGLAFWHVLAGFLSIVAHE